MPELKFSILIPTYKGAAIIGETLNSILFQEYDNFEIIIHDDNSGDNIEEVLRGFCDKRIKFYKNEKNLGYPGNLEVARNKAQGDVIYLMGQDDILGRDALANTYNVFMLDDDIGAVTRPYFWFDSDINKPVRAKEQLNKDNDETIRITDELYKVIEVFKTLDQLSGLAFRAKFMDLPFHQDVFPCHVYPFASIFKKHPVVFLKDYNVAVRVSTSQTRSISSIYEKSPLESWVNLVRTVFHGESFKRLRYDLIKNFVAVNYVGLVQIRNYASFRYLLREIWYLLKYRWQNVYSFPFWFFSLGCVLLPPQILIPLVDWYKNKINSRLCRGIKFDYKSA